jgi:hypothetical protein
LTVSLAPTLPGDDVMAEVVVWASAASGAAPAKIAETAKAIVNVPTFIVGYLPLFE